MRKYSCRHIFSFAVAVVAIYANKNMVCNGNFVSKDWLNSHAVHYLHLTMSCECAL